MYKILIADDHPLFREAIHNVIADGFPGSEVMETADLDSALGLTQEHDDLDLILLDLNMPGMHGLNGLMNLRNEAPTIPWLSSPPSRTSRWCYRPSPTARWASSPSPRHARR